MSTRKMMILERGNIEQRIIFFIMINNWWLVLISRWTAWPEDGEHYHHVNISDVILQTRFHPTLTVPDDGNQKIKSLSWNLIIPGNYMEIFQLHRQHRHSALCGEPSSNQLNARLKWTNLYEAQTSQMLY